MTISRKPVIVWIRRELRLADDSALFWASLQVYPVICVYIHDISHTDQWPCGAASCWWPHYSLKAFSNDLKKVAATLRILCGDSKKRLESLVAETGADQSSGIVATNRSPLQWVAGSGVDAAPYFGVFNPFLQGVRFDPNGEYVRRWVPEISKLPNKLIHAHWTASQTQLTDAGIIAGNTYPYPIVDLATSCDNALRRFEKNQTAR